MAKNGSREVWPGEYVGRLWDHPGVRLRPVRRSVAEFWAAAPRPLQKRARWAMTKAQWALWQFIRDPARLGTPAVARVPVWIPEHEAGFVLDYLLPESGVNVQLDRWRPEYLDDEFPPLDFEADPDNPWNDERDHLLAECCGIEVVHFWDAHVLDLGPEAICEEIRLELGIGRPATLRRDWYAAEMRAPSGRHLPPPGEEGGH